jgi:hypothetical protein
MVVRTTATGARRYNQQLPRSHRATASKKSTCTSTHNSSHHALAWRGGEGGEGMCTVAAVVPPRASHFDLDLHTALQHGQFRGGNISHEQAMVSRDTARVTPRGLSSPPRALSAASKSDQHQQENAVP